MIFLELSHINQSKHMFQINRSEWKPKKWLKSVKEIKDIVVLTPLMTSRMSRSPWGAACTLMRETSRCSEDLRTRTSPLRWLSTKCWGVTPCNLKHTSYRVINIVIIIFIGLSSNFLDYVLYSSPHKLTWNINRSKCNVLYLKFLVTNSSLAKIYF